MDAVLAAYECLEDAEPVDTTAWPISHQQAATRERRRMTRRARQPSRSLEKGLRVALTKTPCRRLVYEDWLRIGFGLHHAEAYGLIENGLDMWVEFSKTDPRRYRPGECAALWGRFDADPPDRDPVTIKTIFAIAKRNGYRPSEYRRRKAVHRWGQSDDPDLNGRQERELNILYSRAKQDRSSRKDGLLVQVRQGDVATVVGCSRRTVVRDFDHLKSVERLREVDQAVVKHESGGHIEKIYELLPVSDRHQRPQRHFSQAEQEAWDAIMQYRLRKAEEAAGPMETFFGSIVHRDGKAYLLQYYRPEGPPTLTLLDDPP